jgi:hypothetical protein
MDLHIIRTSPSTDPSHFQERHDDPADSIFQCDDPSGTLVYVVTKYSIGLDVFQRQVFPIQRLVRMWALESVRIACGGCVKSVRRASWLAIVPVIVKRPDGLPHLAAMSDSRFAVVASSWKTSSRKVVFTIAASIRSEGVVITSPVVGSQLLYLLQLRRCYNVLLKSFAAGPADPHAIDSV